MTLKKENLCTMQFIYSLKRDGREWVKMDKFNTIPVVMKQMHYFNGKF